MNLHLFGWHLKSSKNDFYRFFSKWLGLIIEMPNSVEVEKKSYLFLIEFRTNKAFSIRSFISFRLKRDVK